MESRYVAIIVRMRWDAPESGRTEEHVIRGSVQLVGTDQVRYFSSFDEILEIVKGTALTHVFDRDPNQEAANGSSA